MRAEVGLLNYVFSLQSQLPHFICKPLQTLLRVFDFLVRQLTTSARNPADMIDQLIQDFTQDVVCAAFGLCRVRSLSHVGGRLPGSYAV